MAVKVGYQSPNATSIKEEIYEGGRAVLIREGGHLFVQSRSGSSESRDTLAVHAPGTWLYAQVEEPAQSS